MHRHEAAHWAACSVPRRYLPLLDRSTLQVGERHARCKPLDDLVSRRTTYEEAAQLAAQSLRNKWTCTDYNLEQRALRLACAMLPELSLS